MNKLLSLENISFKLFPHSIQEKVIFDDLSLDINEHDFITLVGSNGAGKSTLFNLISGELSPTSGRILLKGDDITKANDIERTKYIARVFQDPKLGTAPRMTVAENLLLSEKRHSKRRLIPRGLNAQKLADYQQLTKTTGNGLDDKLQTETGHLSGGQRQALSFLMATQTPSDLLLLDEHTSALDPKTGQNLMQLTNATITSQRLTTLMITHNLADALVYGNRLIVLHQGKITLDISGKDKAQLTRQELFDYFDNY